MCSHAYQFIAEAVDCSLGSSLQCLRRHEQMKGEHCPCHDHTEQRDPHFDPLWCQSAFGEHVVHEEVEKNHNTTLEKGTLQGEIEFYTPFQVQWNPSIRTPLK